MKCPAQQMIWVMYLLFGWAQRNNRVVAFLRWLTEVLFASSISAGVVNFLFSFPNGCSANRMNLYRDRAEGGSEFPLSHLFRDDKYLSSLYLLGIFCFLLLFSLSLCMWLFSFTCRSAQWHNLRRLGSLHFVLCHCWLCFQGLLLGLHGLVSFKVGKICWNHRTGWWNVHTYLEYFHLSGLQHASVSFRSHWRK